jgi:hypothetical protein
MPMSPVDLAQLQTAMQALQRRVALLEAENTVRGVVAEYMRLCDLLDDSISMEELGALFTRDAIWEGLGARNSSAFGRYLGREAIMAFLDAYRGPVPHFALNVHFLTSETIRFNDDDTISGSWVMLQTSTISRGTSTLVSARLNLRFLVEDGRWRIAHFQTSNLFSRPVQSPWNQQLAIPVPKTS